MTFSQISIGSPITARHADQAFFIANPSRRFFARSYVDGDGPFPRGIALFAADEDGASAEINLVVVARIHLGRVRKLFAVAVKPKLNSDRTIIRFLRSRGVDHRSPIDWVGW